MSEHTRRVAMVNSDGKPKPVLPDPAGVETVMHELRFRVLARTPYEHLFTELGTLDVAERALAEGCDAVYIDTFGDYAIDRVRAMTAVPVVGAGEESIRYAAAQHGTFSIVTVWPLSMRYLYDGRLRATDGGDSCLGVHHLAGEEELDRVGQRNAVKQRMRRHEVDIIDELAELCRRACAEDGSASVLLGCTCMSPVAEALQEKVDLPILEPSRIGLRAAHAAALAGAEQSRAASVQHSGLAAGMVDAYLAADGQETAWLDDCEVCAITQTIT